MLDRLPADVLEVHPDLGRPGSPSWRPPVPAPGSSPSCQVTSWPARPPLVDPELDVALTVGAGVLGATGRGRCGSVDLDAVDARPVRRPARPVEGGPVNVIVADVDGLAGGGWREPGLLLGAGIALSVLVGSLILVLARGRAGALLVASEAEQAREHSEQNFRRSSSTCPTSCGDRRRVGDDLRHAVGRRPARSRRVRRSRAVSVTDLVIDDDRALLTSLSTRSGVSEKGLVRFVHSDGSDRSFEVVVANRSTTRPSAAWCSPPTT